MPHPPDLDQLFADLAHPNPYIKTRAFTAMVEHWPDEAIPRLIALLDQPDVSLRRASVRGLGAFGARSMQPIAECFSTSSDDTVRASCIKAYAQLASNYAGQAFTEQAMAVLREALDDRSPVVAVAAVMALGQVGRQAVPLLLQVSRGNNPAQGVAAVNALAQIDHPAIEPALQQLLDDPATDDYVRETVSTALIRIEDLKARQYGS
jgi:bilin biosynthesis protein